TELQKKLALTVPAVGSSFRNPVDVGSPGPTPAVLKGVLERVSSDSSVDTIIVSEIEMCATSPQARAQEILSGRNREELARTPVEVKREFGKPTVMVLPVEATGSDVVEFEGARRNVCDYYLREGIPVFLTLERAAKALANMAGYYEHLDAVSASVRDRVEPSSPTSLI
ncbi:MAG: hypothetical protein V1932_00090, partial [Chloroflexota bacterium]